jgi:hypothetical protein
MLTLPILLHEGWIAQWSPEGNQPALRGHGMDPVFKRLDPPNSAVVEMRTEKTRTFGFFAGLNTYVAVSMAETATLKIAGKSDPYEEHAAKVQALISRLRAADIDRTTDVEKLVTDVFP